MDKLTIRDLDLPGQRVFIRVDFNVPIKDSQVEDDTRIRAAIATITYATEHGARVILASHVGRPKGQRVEKYSLRPVYLRLQELLGTPAADVAIDSPIGAHPPLSVNFVEDCIGEQVTNAVAKMKDGDVLLLENLRFHPEEEKNDEQFARQLASLCDVYVNDPQHPFVAILGGAKVSDKIPVINALIDRKVDRLLIGGAMAYTFLKADGFTVGKSLVENEMLDTARQIKERCEATGVELLLPSDHQVVDSYEPIKGGQALAKTIPVEFTNAGHVGMDIGVESIALFSNALLDTKTIIWNGPMGVFEEPPFNQGTIGIAHAVADAADRGAIVVVGGGDSVAAVTRAGVADRITHISTGGGATLEFLAGKELPGV